MTPSTALRASRSQQGLLLVAVSALWFAATNMMVRALGPQIPSSQVAFLRSLIGLFPVAAVMLHRRIGFGSARWPLLVSRGLSGLGALVCFFWALVHIPIATAVMFNYTAPVFATCFAVLFMGERLKPAKVLCLLVAFGGMVLMLRPSFEGSPLPYLIALCAGLFSASSFIAVKNLTRSEPSWRIILFFNLTACIGASVPAVAQWAAPDATQWLLLVSLAVTATVGQMFMTEGFDRAPVSLTGPATLLTVLFTSLGGWMLWGEALDAYSILGMAGIAAGIMGLAAPSQRLDSPSRPSGTLPASGKGDVENDFSS